MMENDNDIVESANTSKNDDGSKSHHGEENIQSSITLLESNNKIETVDTVPNNNNNNNNNVDNDNAVNNNHNVNHDDNNTDKEHNDIIKQHDTQQNRLHLSYMNLPKQRMNNNNNNNKTRPLSIVSTLLQNCLCDTSVFYHNTNTSKSPNNGDSVTDKNHYNHFYRNNRKNKIDSPKTKNHKGNNNHNDDNNNSVNDDNNNNMMIIQLMTGIKYIGLGAMIDELTTQERVYDTLEVLSLHQQHQHRKNNQFLIDSSRIISIGHLVRIPKSSSSLQSTLIKKQSNDQEEEHSIEQKYEDENDQIQEPPLQQPLQHQEFDSSNNNKDLQDQMNVSADKEGIYNNQNEPVLINYIPYDLWIDELTEFIHLAKTTTGKNSSNSSMVYLSNSVQRILSLLIQCTYDEKVDNYDQLLHGLKTDYEQQIKHQDIGMNSYLVGITAHNIGVVYVLENAIRHNNKKNHGDDSKSESSSSIAIEWFQKAIQHKRNAFGDDNNNNNIYSIDEIAVSLDELGIQLFANGQFQLSKDTFQEAQSIREKKHQQQQANRTNNIDNDATIQQHHLEKINITTPTSETMILPAHDQPQPYYHPSIAMVLNNIACCEFQMGNHIQALNTLEKGKEIQHIIGTSMIPTQRSSNNSASSFSSSETIITLDLLHVAIVYCNCGYLHLTLKQYEDAISILEEALLLYQSILGEEDEDIKDDNERRNNHHSITTPQSYRTSSKYRAIRDTLSNLELANAFHS